MLKLFKLLNLPGTGHWYIEITEAGMESSVKLRQQQYLLLIDYQYPVAKKVEKWIYWFCLHSERAIFNVFNFCLYENYVCMLSNPFVLMFCFNAVG